MRFRFVDPNAAGEAVAREKVFLAMDAWWRAFAKNADAIARSFKRDAPRFALPAEWVGIWDDSPAPPGFEPLDASGRA